jgi:hypothetical protein
VERLAQLSDIMPGSSERVRWCSECFARSGRSPTRFVPRLGSFPAVTVAVDWILTSTELCIWHQWSIIVQNNDRIVNSEHGYFPVYIIRVVSYLETSVLFFQVLRSHISTKSIRITATNSPEHKQNKIYKAQNVSDTKGRRSSSYHPPYSSGW